MKNLDKHFGGFLLVSFFEAQKMRERSWGLFPADFLRKDPVGFFHQTFWND